MPSTAGLRHAVRGAWLGWVLAGVVLLIADLATPVLAAGSGAPFGDVADAMFAATALAVPGGLLASRQPRNAIGWLLLAGALGQAIGEALGAYGLYGVRAHPGALPFAMAVWTVGGAGWWMVMFFAVPLLLIVFPSGRLPSGRWRPAAGALVVLAALLVVGEMFGPAHIGGDIGAAANPLAHLVPVQLIFIVAALAAVWVVVLTVAAIVSLIRRLRRSSGVERAQYQWFTYGTALCGACFVLAFIPGASGVVVLAGLTAFLTGLTVAILRFRLFEIGRLVSRTISYALLTALLAACFFGLVALITAVVHTAGSVAVASATLVAAAAFNPLRRRLQVGVDRRFNRQRYDAGRTVEGFAQCLRGEIDLDALVAELRGVVQVTLEPADVRLWLRNRPLDAAAQLKAKRAPTSPAGAGPGMINP